jgi:Na+/H+-dicarboxylate symporter
MSLTAKVLIALVAGVALGLALAGNESALASTTLSVLQPVGTLFVNAIRMTVIPLVMSSLIAGVTAAPDARAVGRLGARAMLLFVIVLSLASALGVLAGGPLLGSLTLDPTAVDALRTSAAGAGAAAGEQAKSVPTMGQWLVSLVPSNPVRAAVDGAMLPLIVFSITFGLALLRVAAERRAAVVRVVQGVMDASLVLVRAILDWAPLGVFALAVPLAATMGLDALRAIGGYIVIVCGLCVVFVALVLYPAAVVLGRVPLARFARAALPAQSIAFSSRSSLAALPALLETVRDTLRLPPTIGSVLIPLSATLFRTGAGIGQTVGVLFVARLYGVELDASQLLGITVTSVVTSFSVPGIPGGSIVVMVPVLLGAGIPVEGLGVLLGADTIPDMFRTTTNVTGTLAASVILARGEEATADPAA